MRTIQTAIAAGENKVEGNSVALVYARLGRRGWFASCTAIAVVVTGGVQSALRAAPVAAIDSGATPDSAAETGATDGGPGDILVTAHRSTEVSVAAKKLADVAGGTGIVDASAVEKGGILTNADVLALQPGVYAQTAAGSDAIKISIRGSSINRGAGFFRSGALFLFDGLPVTGPGGTPYELFEPLGLNHTEILRGANGFEVGSLTLGGAIDYVSKTGADATPIGLRLETGSYGYRKYQVSSGGAYGPFDYYISVTGARRDGYQQQSRGRNFGVAANIGYQIAPDIETRFYLRYRRTNNQTPGNLTIAQIEDDPRQANPVQLAQNASRVQPGSVWVANKTTFTLDDKSRLALGLVYHNYPIDIRGGVTRAKWKEADISGSLLYERNDKLFGRDSKTTVGLLVTTRPDGKASDQTTYVRIPTGPTASLPVGTEIRHALYNGLDGNLYVSNDSEPIEHFHVVAGISLIRIERSTRVDYPYVEGVTTPYSRKSWNYAPRLGLRYDVTPDIQLFGNVSRSVEPPNDWAILSTPPSFPSTSPASGLAERALDLKDQTATSYEIGTRGNAFFGAWTLSLFRSDVRHELLSVEVVPATATTAAITAESNASPTTHQGVEVGLDAVLWHAPSNKDQAIKLRQTYTYSDFKFKHDAVFGKNTMPGIPKHVYQAELSYDDPSGFYISGNTYVASRNWLDYADSVAAKSYAIFGATIGFDVPRSSYKIFADFQNIGNKHYGAVVSPVYNLRGSDAANPRLTPGDGFTVIGGVSFGF